MIQGANGLNLLNHGVEKMKNNIRWEYILLFVLTIAYIGCNDISNTENKKLLKTYTARHSSDLSNLGVILLKYAYDNEKLPAKLSVLYSDDYCKVSEYFVCQNVSNTPLPQSAVDIENGACDYYYFGKGHTIDSYPQNLPIIVTKPEIYPDKTILLLYKNGLVRKEKTDKLEPEILKLIQQP
jgi:hypothetical protein